MAVYSTMIRDDPDSRARLRVTPEQAPELPQLLLPRLLDRARHPRTRFTGADLPAARRRRATGPSSTSPPKTSASAPTPSNSSQPSTLAHPTRSSTVTAASRLRTRHPRHRQREYLAVPYEEKDAAKRLGARWDAERAELVHPRRRGPRAVRALERLESHSAAETAASATPNGNEHHRNDAPADEPAENTARPENEPTGRRAPARGAGRLRGRRPSRRTSPTARSAGSSDAGYPGHRRASTTRRRPTACASSRSWTASTRSAPPTSSTAPPSLPAALRRGLRDPRAARPRRPGAQVADRPRRVPHAQRHHRHLTASRSSTATA